MKKHLLMAGTTVATMTMGALHAQANPIATFKTVQDVIWNVKQPGSSSHGDHLHAALVACTQKIEHETAIAQDVMREIADVSYRNVSVVRLYSTWSDTKKDPWTGERSHKAGGAAECSYYQEVNLKR